MPLALAELPTPIHQVPLHEQARSHLRRMIVRGELPPGENIGEAELCRTLGVSRTPLREALKLLAAEGLVDLPSNRGAFVAPIRADEIADTFEVVARLEQLGAERAAIRAAPRDLATLQALQDRMEAEHCARRRVPYFEINQRIHRAIVAIGGNQALVCAHEMLFARIERVRFLAIGAPLRWDESIREHREVLAALAARDAARAGAAMTAHVRHTGQRMAALLGAVVSSSTPQSRSPSVKRQTRSKVTP